MNFYNKVLDKKSLKRIVSWFIDNYGPTRTTLLLDEFKTVGFHYAGKAGLSLGFDDLRIPLTKKNLLATAQDQVQLCEKTYSMGLITAFERYQKLIDIWTTTSEKLKDEVIQNFESIQGGPLASPLYMMAFSGARGNISQVRQLVGMRGLMSDSGGGIIDFPIRSNFREGLSVTEYVISCYGARKGLIDTALRTADSGYLTRRLVDVAHGIIIREIDCGSYESVFIKVSDTKNLIGRVLAETLSPCGNDQRTTGPSTERRSSKPSFWRNQEISPRVAVELKTLKGSKASIAVRSPLTCLSQSVCQLCYGWNLAQGRLVSLGDAVGILAAQSIGEPGTQLTMRTFHTGGIFSSEVEDKVYSPQEGIVFIQSPGRGSGPSASGRINPPQTFGRGTELLQLRLPKAAAAAADQRSGLELSGPPASAFGSRDLGSFGPSVDNSVLLRGCKIRSVHGQTAFFVFDSIQLKIQNQIVKDQRTQSSGTSFCRESIVQLPPQSIIFVSPGNTLKKNTLFAEISRIQQPPTLLDDQPEALEALNRTFGQLRTSGSQPSVEDAGPLVSRSPRPEAPFGPSGVATEGRALRGTKFTAFGSRDLWSKGASPDGRRLPLVLQSSSPPSEQGSPRPGTGPLVNGLRHERRLKSTSSPSRLSEAEPSAESRGQKNIKQNFHRDIDLNSLREAAAAEGRRRGRPKKQKSIQLKDNLQLASRKVFSEIQGEVMEIFENPKKHPANVLPSSPLERSSKLPRPAGGSHSTEAHLQGKPDLQGRSPGPTKLRVVLSGEPFVFRPHKRKTNPSGFRQGDIVFWKGQRKELVSTGLQHQTTPGFRNQNWETKFLHPEQSEPLAATFVGRLPAAIPPFEIRRVQGPDDGAGETRPTALKGKQSKLDNELQYSGLIVHFEHQKEKQTKVATSSRPSVEEQSSCGLRQPPEAPFGPKKNQKEKIGKLCQPYRNYKAFLGSQTPSLNLPTQILRRRKNKLILRHVQVSLGMDQRSLVENSVPQPKTFRGLRLGTLPPADFGRHPESSGKNASSQVSGGLTSFSHYVKERDLLFQLILPISQSSSSSDIVQGLPKIEQLFEARARFNDNRSKQSAPTIGPEATRRPKGAGPSVGGAPRSSCALRQPPEAPFGPSVSPERTSFVPRGPTGASGRDELRWAGAPPPPEGSSLRSAEENENTNQILEERAEGRSTLELRNLQKRLIQEIQLVYNSQGVDIADKHLEIIVRQMTSQIRVLEKGETPYFPEDIVNGVLFHSSKESIETDNLSPLLQNLRWAEPHEVPAAFGSRRRLPLVLPAETKGSKPLVSVFKQQPASDWVLMGITKVALLATTESYISAASFQETKRVLMNSALQTRVDFFEGLKENVIVGRMIPAGTGAKG